jgi:hypothetical protein
MAYSLQQRESERMTRPLIQKTGTGKRGRKTKEESAYIDRAVSFGCLLTYLKTGISGTPAAWHHQRTGTGAGCIAKHEDGIALSPYYHDQSGEAFHVMGRKAWEAHHGYTEKQLVEMTKEMFKGLAHSANGGVG